MSIKVGTTTYTFDGTNFNDGQGHTTSGAVLTATTSLGTLTFNFSTGAYSYSTSASVSANQTETFHYTLVDKDGDQSGADLSIIIKNAPHAPTGLDLASADDSGNNSDNVTNHTTGLTISGAAENGTTVTLYDDVNNNGTKDAGESTLGTANVSGGTFSVDVALAEGVHHVRGFETDGSGNVSPSSAPLDITVDTTAPVVAFTNMVNDTGLSSSDYITNDDNKLTFNGTGEAGGTVTLTRGNSVVGSATVDGTGHWTITDGDSSINDGTYTYKATETDLAGNIGNTATVNVTVDTVRPTEDVSIKSIAQDTGVSSTDFVTNDTQLTVSGTNDALAAGDRVQVSSDGTNWVDATQVDATHWTYVDPATHTTDFTYYARVVDTAGNVSSNSHQDSRDVDIDLTPPTTTVAISGIQSDTGASSSDFITSDRTLTLNGTYGGSLGSNVIQVSTDGGQTWNNASSSFGSWNYSDPATHADGTFTYQVRVIDVAGNVGNTTSHSVTVDGTAPTIAIATTLAGDNVVNATEDGSIVISGTTTGAEDGRTVTVILSDGSHTVTKTATVSNGIWSTSGADISGFNNGNVTVRADVSDVAGNAATQASKTITLDNLATISIASTIAGDNIVNAAEDGSVVISGTTTGVENGRTVTVTLSDGVHAAVTTTATVNNNAWTASGADISGLNNGGVTVKADVSDLAGNAATQASKTITLDNVAPTVAIAATVAGDNIVNAAEDNSVAISGTTTGVENGRTVTVTLSDGVHAAVTTTATVNNNAWTASGANITGLNNGSITVKADVSDLAGNAATQASKSITLDNVAPTIAIASTIAGDNVVNAAEDGSVVISGTTSGVENGRTVTVTLSDGVHAAVTTMATVTNNAWTASGADISGLNNGSITVKADVSDLAGNAATQASKTIALDTVATIAIAATVAGDNIVNAAEDNSVVISGTTTGVENGRTVTVTLSDGVHAAVTTTATVNNNAWTASGANITGLNNGSITVKADVSDAVGNQATQASKTITLDNVAPTVAVAATIAGDNIVNAAEDNTVVISGTTSGVENGRTVTVTLSDGVHAAVTTTATVNNNTWTATSADIHNLNDGNITVLANVSDAAGNAATQASKTVVLDNAAPTVAVTQTHSNGSGTFSFTFSEAVSGFTKNDLSFGSKITSTSNLVFAGVFSGKDVYTLDFTYSGTGNRTATVANGSYVDLAGNAGAGNSSANFPAGTSGEAINLALASTVAASHVGPVALTISGVLEGWTLSDGTRNADGTWSVLSNDVSSLSVTSPDGFTGALVFNVMESWTNADGSVGTAYVLDNVEAYAKGAPIFAWSGDDTLTASSGNDTLVFANRIGTDVVHKFDVAHDKIDLIGFDGFSSFADVQAHLSTDAAGNAVLTLGDGQTITLTGVDAHTLTGDDFVFNETPVIHNTGDMVLGDGAMLPLSGIVDNSGRIELGSAGSTTELEIVQHGATLQGGGTIVLSDNSENLIVGSQGDVTLTNVDNTIMGAGEIGDGQLTLVNEGTIMATGVNALVIDTGTNVITNSGTLEAAGSGGLIIHGTIDNEGLLWANDGDLSVSGDVNGGGSALISGHGLLELAGAFGGEIKFDATASGTLVLDNPSNFHGVLSGFDGNDTLDLEGFLGASTTMSYNENAQGNGGVLTVTDGKTTANIAFSGEHAASDFHLDTGGSANQILVHLENQAQQQAAQMVHAA